MEQHQQLTDSAFEHLFETATLDPSIFSHEAHLRLAWIHLEHYGLEQAIENVSTQIQHFVKQLGAADKYHATLTVAAVKIVQQFRKKSQSTTFLEFIEEFPRLKHNFKDLVNQHYTANIYNSATAKQKFIKPDLLAFS